MSLVNFFNSGSLSGSTTRSSTRCPSRHSPWCSSRHSSSSLRPSCTLVHLGNNRVAHTFQLFLLILIFILFCSLICIKPLIVSSHLSVITFLSLSLILPFTFSSSKVDFMLKQYDSKLFFAEIRSFCKSSSALYFSASLTIFSISSLERRPLSFVIVILFCFPVDLSQALTLRIPFASTSKVTSICGTPLGAGGIPVKSNLPRR